MSGFGESGPARDRMAYGAVIDALCGAAAANGTPGGGPTFFPMSMPDPCAGIHAAIAASAAMYRAAQTGRGDRIEMSMIESTISAFPWPVLIEAAGRGPVVNVGNRDDLASPHGTFRCAGERQWLAVVVFDDDEFRALATRDRSRRPGDGATFRDARGAQGARGRAGADPRRVDGGPSPRHRCGAAARRRRRLRGGRRRPRRGALAAPRRPRVHAPP